MVRITDNATIDTIDETNGDDEDQILILLDPTPGMSQAKMAEALGWVSQYGPDKARVNNLLASLVRFKLADKDRRGKYSLSEKGRAEAKRLRRAT